MRSTTKKVQTIESTTATTPTTTIVTETILGLPKVIFYVAIIGASILLIGAIVGIILAVRSCKSTTGYDYSSGIKARGASLPMHRYYLKLRLIVIIFKDQMMDMETCQIPSAQCTLAANLATLDEQLYLTAQIRPDPIASDRSRPEQNKIT